MEQWERILNGNYEVSNTGLVRNALTKRILKPYDQKGYLKINIKGKSYRVHRLVALAFIPNPKKLPCVDHIDTNRKNNAVDNLKWTDVTDNNNNPLTMAKKQKIISAFRNGEKIRTFRGIRYAAKVLQVNKTSILRCLSGKQEKAFGFEWKYE